MKKNIVLKISYDGSNYNGWQKQKDVKSRTIQHEIQQAIYKITGEEVELTASGRTDAGVHALGQIANFATNSSIPEEKFAYALNTKLPDDIRIISSYEAEETFNARFSSKKKTYIYRIFNADIKSPFYYKYTMLVRGELDFEKMCENVKQLVGTHDFTSFYTREKDNPKNPVRTIYDANLTRHGDIIEFSITGNGFLYNMVRIIAGTLIAVGQNKTDMDIFEIMRKKDRKYAGATAKASGLFLKEVKY